MMIRRTVVVAVARFMPCLFIVALFSPSHAFAQTQSAPTWSFTVLAPPVIEAGTNSDIFVKCKLTNLSTSPLAALQRAHLLLIDSGSQTQQLVHYTSDGNKAPLVGPGESTVWWQHGRATTDGNFKLFARWDPNKTVESAPVPVTIRRSDFQTDDPDSYRNRLLRQAADRFPEFVPNTNTTVISYTSFTFTNDPVLIDGSLYNAISFVVPDRGGELVWSFIIDTLDHVSWGIIPADGPVKSFTEFYSRDIGHLIPGIANAGDTAIFQRLPAEDLIPHHRYYIWFQCPYRDFPGTTLSLNIFPNGHHSYRDVFPSVYH